MLPYFSLLIVITITSLLDGKKIDKIIFIGLVLWMLIFSALRVGGVGTGDYEAYLQLYSLTDSFEKVINPEIHAEIGFRILSFIGNYLGFESQYIIVVMATLALLPVTYIIYRYSPYKILSLLVLFPYFLTMNMHSSRTSVAAAFGLLFIINFLNKKWFYALLSFIVSISFHSSALVLILVLLVMVSLKKLLIFLFSSLIFLIFLSPFELMIMLFNSIGLDRLSTFVQIYMTSDEYGYPLKVYDPRIILGVGVVFLIFKCQKNISRYFGMNYFKIYIIGVLSMILFSSVVIMAWRLSYFFLIMGVLVLPMLAKIYNEIIYKNIGSKRVMNFIFTILYILYATPIILNAEPYKFFLG